MPTNPAAPGAGDGVKAPQIVPSDSTDVVIAPGSDGTTDSSMPWWVWLGLAWLLMKGLKRR